VYGYTDENGVLILSNVPTDDRMRKIVDGTAEEAGKVWRYNGQYDDLILRASYASRVDASLIRAVIAVESAFNRYARSHAGALGLMQLIPETARRYGVANPFDPWQNIRAGTAHLRDLLDEFEDLRLALAAYNAGPTPVRRYGTIPPYKETRNYVRKVMAIYRAGASIKIVKGDRVYSITEPGGRTNVRVQVHPDTGRRDSSGSNSNSLAELARRRGRNRVLAVQGPSRRPQRPASRAGDALDAMAPDSVYYRYRDAQGVVHITRTRPQNGERFEILAP
jgi:soluble lytic murein transglycosylase